MRFLLFLLFPNLYDIFTAIMIGYAFMLHQKGELQISFGLACGLIYIATRLGIIAGKILHMILGKPQTDEVDEQDAGGKRFIFDFGPQIICVVAFQVIMMITSLPHSATPAQTDKVAEQNKQAIEQVDQKQDGLAATEDTVASAGSAKSDYDELFTEDEDVSAQQKAQTSNIKPAVNTTYSAPRKYVAPKAYSQTKVSVTEVEPQQTAQPAPVVEKRPVYIPERTLNIAGVSPAELNIANIQTVAANNTQVQPQATTRISAVAPATTSAISSSGNLTPKRYPGDDNPIPTTWGYYKSAPTHTTQSQEAAAQNYQNNNNRTIPANTLKVIGY